MCDAQRAPLELCWRARLEFRGCVLSGWGVVGSTGEVLSTFGARVSSLLLVRLLLSSEGLHSNYFRELVSLCGRGASL